MTHDRSPPSTISRNMRCSSIESAVVSVVGRSTPAMRLTTVPRRAGRRPAVAKTSASRWAVVVLPFVPVTATTRSSRVGSTEETRRHESHGVPGARDDDLGDRQGERSLADERDRPGGDRLGGEVVPVGLQSGDAEEKRSGSDVAGAAGQRSDVDVGIAVDATTFKTGGECGYVHAGR